MPAYLLENTGKLQLQKKKDNCSLNAEEKLLHVTFQILDWILPSCNIHQISIYRDKPIPSVPSFLCQFNTILY